jgi:chorismate-pyruvate lyase
MIDALHLTQTAPTTNDDFDPFADLILMQREKPRGLRSIDLRTLTPFQRALLSIDGTVTKFIEAYTLEPIQIMRLRQQEQMLQAEHHWLDAPQGTKVIAREVLLRGKYSGTIYAYAVSLLIPSRLPASVMEGLDVEPAGLGRILLNSQLENRRDILWYGRECVETLPEAVETETGRDFISRTYRIVVDARPIMLINEKFPISMSSTDGTIV